MAAYERLEDLRLLGRGDTVAVVDDADRHAAIRTESADLDWLVGRGELRRVVDQVGEDALELRGVGAYQRKLGGDVDLDREVAALPAYKLGGPGDRVVQVTPVRMRVDGARFDPREVEQVADHPLQAIGLGAHYRGKLHAVVLRQAGLTQGA